MLTAPFPYHGGKRRLAAAIWERLGNPTVYAEPFYGSGACLLARPGGAGPREIACDRNGGLINFWRAVEWGDIDELCYWLTWPTFHHDLSARHIWLRQWLTDHRDQLAAEPEFFDTRAAGWWVWGMSLWIGGQWCDVDDNRRPSVTAGGGKGVSAQSITSDKRPHTSIKIGGRGVSAQRTQLLPAPQRPHVKHRSGGQGVSAQRTQLPPTPQMPHIGNKGGGQGVSAQRVQLPPSSKRPHIKNNSAGQGVSAQTSYTRPELTKWFRALQDRMRGVVLLNLDWTSALTPTLLQQTPSSPKATVGVFLDPPYVTKGRHANLYSSDRDGTSDHVAAASYRWAIEHGHRYRIAYAMKEGDFPVPEEWGSHTASFPGIRKPENRKKMDQIIFSPACKQPSQQGKFDL